MKKDELSISKSTGNIQPPKKDPTDKCNARHKDDYCNQPAGFGTNHVGTGRCKYHGGLSSGRPKKSFSAAEFLNSEIISKFESISDVDPSTISNVDNEINVVRSSFYQYVQECVNKKFVPDPSDLKKFTDSLTRLIAVKTKLETKAKDEVPKILIFYVNKVTTILDKYIQDPMIRKSIASEMRHIPLLETEDDGTTSRN